MFLDSMDPPNLDDNALDLALRRIEAAPALQPRARSAFGYPVAFAATDWQ